ncbi:MAG: hypothetical protein ACXU8N_13060 [Telluria sp.]
MSAAKQSRPWPQRRLDAVVVAASICFVLGFTWLHGTDLNWDLQNYHLYSGFAFVHDRLGSEFMGAGMMGYLNPLPMVPFYAMVAAGWHSIAIGTVLALEHATNLVLLWLICRRLLGEGPYGHPLSALALMIGAASPVFIAEIGTSYADISTAPLVLAGILLLLGDLSRGRVLAAGALLGAAVGLKLTNLPFALASGVLLFAPDLSWRQRIKLLGWLVLGGFACGVLTAGDWAWRLYREFHNPVFPFMNNLFRSPDFPPVGHVHRRFLPQTFAEALLFPFRLALPKTWIYTETFTPDLRFGLCVITGWLALVAVAVRLVRRNTAVALPHPRAAAFLGYFVLAWTLWLVQFANGRYFMPLAFLVGPALVLLLAFVLPRRRAVLVAIVCFVLQVGQQAINTMMTFGGTGHWPERWVRIGVPARLREHPYLYLSIDQQSNSYLAPFVHPDARFLNVDGMVPLSLEGPGGARVRAQLDKFKGATRVLLLLNRPLGSPKTAARFFAGLDVDLNRFGLRIDQTDCPAIVDRDLLTSIAPDVQRTADSESTMPKTVLACATVAASRNPELRERDGRAARVFDAIEIACPRQIPTRWNGAVLHTKDGRFAVRFYVDTDLWLETDGREAYAYHSRFGLLPLGAIADLLDRKVSPPCEQIRFHEPATIEVETAP